MTAPRATVVIPVKDGAKPLAEVLPALAAQRFTGGLETVAVDSGSRDGSRDLLARHGARTVSIAPEAFDHGETRNLGAREARGATIVFLTQDAVPESPDTLERLVGALESDPRLAGAFARQRPRADADPLTRRELEGWVAARPEPRTAFLGDPAAFEALSPLERYERCAFDDVASAVRKDLLLAHPFAPTRFGEDLEWSVRMLRMGHGIAYVPEAVVVHSHERRARALFRRNYLGHRLLFRLFGLRTVPDLHHLVRAAAGAVAGDLTALARAGASARLLAAAPVQSIAGVLGQWMGGRDEALGRPYPEWSRPGR
jgi:rhamnosyltransferase